MFNISTSFAVTVTAMTACAMYNYKIDQFTQMHYDYHLNNGTKFYSLPPGQLFPVGSILAGYEETEKIGKEEYRISYHVLEIKRNNKVEIQD